MHTKVISFITALVLALPAYAHELTPTYVLLEKSFVQGISKTSLMLFNRREDVRFYEIQVFDEEWNEIEFASEYKIVEIDYLKRKKIDVYVKPISNPVYICTTSKIEKEKITATVISSRVCSKIK